MNKNLLQVFPFVCVVASLLCSTAAGQFQWHRTPAGHDELRNEGRPVLRYMATPYDDSTAERRDESYKVYHHVFSPDGTQLLTKGPGGLYPHHRGLFFGFSKTGYNNGQICDTWHCQGNTHQSHAQVLHVLEGSERAGHELLINWHGNEGDVVAHERRELIASQRDGATIVDFRAQVTPAGDWPLTLDGDPQHAGFQFRASQEVAADTSDQTYYLRTDGQGKPGETRNWNHQHANDPANEECTNRPWNAMSFVVGGQRYTALYLDHPDNPKPARYSERDYGRFGSYFVGQATKEKPLEVRYRVVIQAGKMTVDQCALLSQEFTSN